MKVREASPASRPHRLCCLAASLEVWLSLQHGRQEFRPRGHEDLVQYCHSLAQQKLSRSVCALQARHIQASPHSRVTPPPPLGPDARLVHGTALRSTVQATAARRTAREAARSEKSKRMGLLRVAAMPRAKRKLCVVISLQRAGLVPRGHRRQCPKKASAAGPPVVSTENPGKDV